MTDKGRIGVMVMSDSHRDGASYGASACDRFLFPVIVGKRYAEDHQRERTWKNNGKKGSLRIAFAFRVQCLPVFS